MINGGSSSRCCPSDAVPDGHGPTTGVFSKAFSGSSKPVPAGVTCPHATHRRAPAGDGCGCGKRMMSGWTSGARSCADLMLMAACNGRNVLRTAVLPPPKRGRRRRQNQARQGHEVDGGGRRPRYSSGKHTPQCQSGGGDLGGEHAGSHLRATPTWWTSAAEAPARDRRPCL